MMQLNTLSGLMMCFVGYTMLLKMLLQTLNVW